MPVAAVRQNKSSCIRHSPEYPNQVRVRQAVSLVLHPNEQLEIHPNGCATIRIVTLLPNSAPLYALGPNKGSPTTSGKVGRKKS